MLYKILSSKKHEHKGDDVNHKICGGDKEWGDVFIDFLKEEMIRLCGKNKSKDIFRDMNLIGANEFEKLHH